MELKLRINGEHRTIDVDVRDSLLDVLRERLQLTGAKRGCDSGACGACTVWLDGVPVNACLVPAVETDGRQVVTIEGMRDAGMRVLQEAFVEHGAVQCGFCTCGMLMRLAALRQEPGWGDQPPPRRQIRAALVGNLCRCTGYQKIVDAAAAALRRWREETRDE